jgi:hypothetical protein
MADDNTLAQLLNSGAGTEANYYNILNRRTAVDDIGDAFSSQANRPALNGKQRMSNAMMAGMGAGFKASQTHIRDKKMQEVEGMLKEVVDQRVKLQSQLGKQQLTKASFANYAMDNYGDLKRWNDAEGAGDQQSSNELGMVLFNRFAEQNPDMAKKMGKIDHVYGGKAYFDKDGKVGGMYIKDLLEPLISTLPEDQQKELSNLTSLTMRNKFKKTDLFEDAALSEKYANIKAHNASANQANAHADYYRAEAAGKANPSSYNANNDEKALRKRSEVNYKFLQEKVQPRLVANEKVQKVYSDLAQLIEANPNLTGSSLQAKFQRTIATSFGLEGAAALDMQNLNSIEFEKQLRPLLGAQFGQQEGERVLGKFVGFNKDIRTLRAYLPKEIEKMRNEIAADNQLKSMYDNNPSANLLSPKDYDDKPQEQPKNTFDPSDLFKNEIKGTK